MKKLFFGTLLVLLPTLALVGLLEAALRLAGFGYPTDPLVRVESAGETVWVGNPDFTRLYFPAALKRLPPLNRVAVEKPPGTRRYMIVGGSAAAGDPDADFSIARNLEWILSTAYPAQRWEVLNLAYTACNSHVAAEVVRRSGPYDLDGLIVLVGNNEVIGPFGPGSTMTSHLPSLWKRDFQVALRRTRLGQLGQILRERISGGGAAPETWRGMEHFLEHRIAFGDPRLEPVYTNFQANLESMEARARNRNIPIVLATVPVNLLDHPPFAEPPESLPASIHQSVVRWLETGQLSMPPESARAAADAHPGSAWLAYMAGRLLLESGEATAGQAYLGRARDLDQLRFRADSRLNAIIRDQWAREQTHWLSLDAEAPLIADNPRHALGFPHFYEHVHFSFRANFLIAREMARTLLAREGISTAALDQLEWTQAAGGLAYTNYEVWRILEEIEARFAQPPFTAIPGYARLTGWMDPLRAALFDRISRAEEKAAMNGIYAAALQLRPEDDTIRLNYARFLRAFGQSEAAYALAREVFDRQPTDSEAAITHFELALLMKQADEAARALRRIEAIFPEHPNLARFREELRKAGK